MPLAVASHHGRHLTMLRQLLPVSAAVLLSSTAEDGGTTDA
jgi:hypothetical protein